MRTKRRDLFCTKRFKPYYSFVVKTPEHSWVWLGDEDKGPIVFENEIDCENARKVVRKLKRMADIPETFVNELHTGDLF